MTLDFLRSEPTLADIVTGDSMDNYLHAMAQPGTPVSDPVLAPSWKIASMATDPGGSETTALPKADFAAK